MMQYAFVINIQMVYLFCCSTDKILYVWPKLQIAVAEPWFKQTIHLLYNIYQVLGSTVLYRGTNCRKYNYKTKIINH